MGLIDRGLLGDAADAGGYDSDRQDESKSDRATVGLGWDCFFFRSHGYFLPHFIRSFESDQCSLSATL
jgi:hypothetical protein